MVHDLQLLIHFLSRRDVQELTPAALQGVCGRESVDAVVLLGNSLLSTIDIAADAIKKGVASKILVAGGIGHSTAYLYENIQKHAEYSCVFHEQTSEAEIFSRLLMSRHGMASEQIIEERRSTNCGANAIEALNTMRAHDQNWKSILLLQDPTMQLRSHLSFTKHWAGVDIISYAPFITQIKSNIDGFEFNNPDIAGLWQTQRFIDIVMGEIPRLRNDENGYGSKGKGFIDDIEIPSDVESAYARLLKIFPEYNQLMLRK